MGRKLAIDPRQIEHRCNRTHLVIRPAPPLQGRTNKTAVLGPAPTDPSWLVPAADRVNVRESLFAEAFNRLLQQNLPQPDSCTAANSILIPSTRLRLRAVWAARRDQEFWRF